MSQPTLFDLTTYEERLARFEAFHADNPQVYEALVDISLQVKRKGFVRFGIRQIWERLRWIRTFQTTGDGDYKLNDHYAPFYARLIMATVPELAGFFEIRGDAEVTG